MKLLETVHMGDKRAEAGMMVTVAGARILLVDDYHDALDMWGFYLRSCGYDVLTAGDGLVALEIASSQLPDLIVLDLDLPGITGYEAAKRLRTGHRTARIPLIAATGFSHVRQLDEARESGFDAVLVKPCDPSALVGEIERVLALARGQRQPPD